jgi:diguanylate cyclase (GGDEF)-like protein
LPDGQAERLHELVEFVVLLASGQLDARLDPSPAGDELDAITVGLNMLAEELQALTVDLEDRVDERTRQLTRVREELERLALYDPLTGLANRALLAERVGQAMKRADRGASPPAVLVLDLDGFKAVNDSFGHLVGDQLLVAVAERLVDAVREADTVARPGGDEFAIVVQDATSEQVLEIAARVQASLAAPVLVGDRSCWVAASVGVCLGTRGQAPDTLLRDADTAMYAAKARMRGGVSVFEPSMHQAALRRMQVAEELRVAVLDHQLFVRYQPIVELATGRIAGLEALVRWNHPERGVLSPDAFISVAEDTGLVTVLDDWVLDVAVAQIARWRATVLGDEEFAMHVNISPVELRAPRFTEGVMQCLARHGVQPSDLTVEITENQLLGEDLPTLQTMETLRAAGIGVAIDDFGTGSSSLGYVRQWFVDTIKIDRSLVWGLDIAPRQHQVAAAILGVIDAFDLAAVAEGVETAGEAEALHTLGCRYGQGFFWHRPLPADEITALFRARVNRPA